MDKVLIFIEAPGKMKVLARSLGTIGIDADIIATKGNLFENPKALFPSGLNERLEETMRAPVSMTLVNKIKSCAGLYRYFILATDPDQEGEVIANDIADLLPGERILRASLRGMDVDSVKKAMEQVKPYDKKQSWQGACRRILDRAIGATFTDTSDGISVGRIQSLLLGLAKAEPQSYGVLKLVAEAEDGGPKFEAHIEINHVNKNDVFQLLNKPNFKVRSFAAEKHTDTPWSYEECVLNCAEKLKASIKDVSDSMQRLYEDGALSYIRSSSKGLTKDALACLVKMAGSHGTDHLFKSQAIEPMHDSDAHEAPRPLTLVDVSIPTRLMNFDDAVLAMITRNLMKCGLPIEKHKANKESLPLWAQSLEWTRFEYPPVPWREPVTEPGIQYYTQDFAIMKMMVKYGIGRPSTQVNHVSRFIEKELLNHDLRLSFKGHKWLAGTPPEFTDLKVGRQIEDMLSSPSDMPPNVKAAWIIEQLGEDISQRTFAAVSQQMKVAS